MQICPLSILEARRGQAAGTPRLVAPPVLSPPFPLPEIPLGLPLASTPVMGCRAHPGNPRSSPSSRSWPRSHLQSSFWCKTTFTGGRARAVAVSSGAGICPAAVTRPLAVICPLRRSRLCSAPPAHSSVARVAFPSSAVFIFTLKSSSSFTVPSCPSRLPTFSGEVGQFIGVTHPAPPVSLLLGSVPLLTCGQCGTAGGSLWSQTVWVSVPGSLGNSCVTLGASYNCFCLRVIVCKGW